MWRAYVQVSHDIMAHNLLCEALLVAEDDPWLINAANMQDERRRRVGQSDDLKLSGISDVQLLDQLCTKNS